MMWHIIRHPNEPESVLIFLFRAIWSVLISRGGRSLLSESQPGSQQGVQSCLNSRTRCFEREREGKTKRTVILGSRSVWCIDSGPCLHILTAFGKRLDVA